MSLSVPGLLIQAVAGILGALGRRVKRRGFAAQAAFRLTRAMFLAAEDVAALLSPPER
jgi:hypothetical protein